MGGDYMGEVIQGFATGAEVPRCQLWFDTSRGRFRAEWQEVADTCARKVGEMLRGGSQDAEAEKRLRRLVAVMLELKSLGLVE